MSLVNLVRIVLDASVYLFSVVCLSVCVSLLPSLSPLLSLLCSPSPSPPAPLSSHFVNLLQLVWRLDTGILDEIYGWGLDKQVANQIHCTNIPGPQSLIKYRNNSGSRLIQLIVRSDDEPCTAKNDFPPWHQNVFRITGHLWWEGGFPWQMTSYTEFWRFPCNYPEQAIDIHV